MPRGLKNQIKVGDKFGNLEVIDINIGYHKEPSGHRRKKVKVRCRCGIEYDLVALYLKRGNSTKCKQCRWKAQRSCKIGEKYDKLTVCGYNTDNKKRPLVICKCDCGTKDILVRSTVLQNNQTNNCGCAPRGGWSGIGEISSTYFYKIKANAEKRKIKFELTIEDIWNLFLSQNRKCSLTNLPIKFGTKTTDKSTASLDRIDSTKHYYKENIQWVHKDINKMKMELNQSKFIKLCRLVVDNNLQGDF